MAPLAITKYFSGWADSSDKDFQADWRETPSVFVSDDAGTPFTGVVIPIHEQARRPARWAVLLQPLYKPISVPRFSLPQILVLDITDSHSQLSECAGLDV